MPRSGRPSKRKGTYLQRKVKRAIRRGDPIPLVDGALAHITGQPSPRAVAMHARKITASIINELGGSAGMPQWRLQLCQRAGMAAVVCEGYEMQRQAGLDIDTQMYALMTRTYTLTLKQLGLDPAQHKIKNPGADDDDATGEAADVHAIEIRVVSPRTRTQDEIDADAADTRAALNAHNERERRYQPRAPHTDPAPKPPSSSPKKRGVIAL